MEVWLKWLFFSIFWMEGQLVDPEPKDDLRVPPQVDKPILVDSYLPASMQVIAHVTDLMKYDLRPGASATPIYITTQRPTSTHKPGLYAPEQPPPPRATTYEEYVQLLQHPEGNSYFDKYKLQLARALDNSKETSILQEIPDDIDSLIGKSVGELLKLNNHLDEVPGDDDDEIQRFLAFEKAYDDDFRIEGRQKRVPPTRAYVSLLSIYDLLNKESKRMGLSKYQGYSEKVLNDLAETSGGTSADQMRFVIGKVIEKKELKPESIINKLKGILKDLEQDNSYLNDALRYIPPLQFAV